MQECERKRDRREEKSGGVTTDSFGEWDEKFTMYYNMGIFNVK